jgi:hypothetical protein
MIAKPRRPFVRSRLLLPAYEAVARLTEARLRRPDRRGPCRSASRSRFGVLRQ